MNTDKKSILHFLSVSICAPSVAKTVLLFSITCCVRAEPPLQRYETKYYILMTDVDREQAQEAAVRMTKMVDEYHLRTRDFAGAIRAKLPFYLYRSRADYVQA